MFVFVRGVTEVFHRFDVLISGVGKQKVEACHASRVSESAKACLKWI